MEDDSEPTLADILAQAIDYIEQYGWFQGTYFQSGDMHAEQCPACAAGALYMAYGDNPYLVFSEGRAFPEQVTRILVALSDKLKTGIAMYNDAKGRTWEEVKTVMLDTLSDLRLKEEANGN